MKSRFRRMRMRATLVALIAALGLVFPLAAPASADLSVPTPVFTPDPGPDPDIHPPILPRVCPPLCLPPLLRPFRFIVVGDSYTSGEGAAHDHVYVGDGTGKELWKHQSGFAPAHVAWTYLEMGRRPSGTISIQPSQLNTSRGPDRLYFHASSGAKTEHLNQEQKESNGDIRNPPQLDDVDTMSEIVYFGMGGNDAGFGNMVSTAFKAYLAGKDPSRQGVDWRSLQQQAVALEVGRLLEDSKMAKVRANIEQALVDTRESVPTADIVVALYPLAVRQSGNIGTNEVTADTMAIMYPFAVAVNQAIKDAVDRFRARFPGTKVHVFDPNTAGPGGTSVVAGHELGQPGSYFNGMVYRPRRLAELKGFQSFQESFHPNEFGGLAIGKALATWMAGEFPDIFPNGPDFNAVNAVPHDMAANDPNDEQSLVDWANTDPLEACDTTDLDSVCRNTGPGGILIPLDPWFPRPRHPIPGAPPVPGGSDQGSPGGGSSGGGGTGIPANYIPMDPCDIFKPTNAEFYRSVTVTGGGLREPLHVGGLVASGPKMECIPGIGWVYK